MKTGLAFLCSLIDLVFGCLHVVSIAQASLVNFNNFNFLVFTSNLSDMEGGVRELGGVGEVWGRGQRCIDAWYGPVSPNHDPFATCFLFVNPRLSSKVVIRV